MSSDCFSEKNNQVIHDLKWDSSSKDHSWASKGKEVKVTYIEKGVIIGTYE